MANRLGGIMFNFLKKLIGLPVKDKAADEPFVVEKVNRPPEVWNNELQKTVPMDEKPKRGRKKKQ